MPKSPTMKHFPLLIFLCAYVGTISPARAQLVVKANPGGLALGMGAGSVEYFVAQNFSAQADVYLIPGVVRDDIDYSGWGAGLSGRIYALAQQRPSGLFLSPFVARHWVSFEDVRSVEHRYSFTALGGQLGYQWSPFHWLTVEGGGGVWTGLDVPTLKQTFGVTDYYGNGLNWYLNLGLGIVLWKP